MLNGFIILNRKKESNKYYPIVDLMSEIDDKDGGPFFIKKSLKPESFGIKPEEYYL